ncbi:hypothetical protein HDU76_008171 [Blyttiomyces sp. JEL0837]|nr:hypothetical protein HDU76_008171 [Blyttiomyces sp. JEL0837]
MQDFHDKIQFIRNKLAHQLIQIPLRQCWMEEFEHLISIDRKNFALMAIILGHLELVKRLVDNNVLEIETFTREEIIACLPELIRSGLDDMLFFCCERFSSTLGIMESGSRTPLFALAVRSGRVEILKYFLSKFSWVDQLTSYYCTTYCDAWEWIMNTCAEYHLYPVAELAINNIEKARRFIRKRGVDIYQLYRAVLHTNFEAFSYLWDHRRIDFWQYMEIKQSTRGMICLRELAVDAAPQYADVLKRTLRWRHFHVASYLYANGCRLSIEEANTEIDDAAKEGKLGAIEFINKRWPDARCSAHAMGTAASRSNLPIVKFLDQNFDWSIDNAFLIAADNGDLEMVKYFVENRKEECNLEKGMLNAIKCGSFKLVRFFYGLGVTKLNDDGVLADVEKWLVQKAVYTVFILIYGHVKVNCEPVTKLETKSTRMKTAKIAIT